MFKRIASVFIVCLFCCNLSKQESSPQYCSGVVLLNQNAPEEKVVDIKIGTSAGSSDNKGIKVYRKPNQQNLKPQDYIEYIFDLENVSKIAVHQQDPVFTYINKDKNEKRDYINIAITNRAGNVTVDCIIPKDTLLIAKVQNTGWTATYHFDTLNEVIIHGCASIETALTTVKTPKD